MLISEDDTEFKAMWTHYAPMLQKALDRCCEGTWLIEDVKQAVMEGRMQIWPLPNACVVTEILTYPRKKALNCWLCGGKMSEMATMYPSLEKFAKENDCYAMYGAGRKGWGKVMATFGWKVDSHVKKVF
jgi:hypothetical protein